jgi:hypothetical protein
MLNQNMGVPYPLPKPKFEIRTRECGILQPSEIAISWAKNTPEFSLLSCRLPQGVLFFAALKNT